MEYNRDGIKGIVDNIGIVCDAYFRVNLCLTLFLRYHHHAEPLYYVHFMQLMQSTGGNIGLLLLEE